MTTAQIVILLVRYGLVVLFFPASALDKILNLKGAVDQAREAVRARAPASLLILVGLAVADACIFPTCAWAAPCRW